VRSIGGDHQSIDLKITGVQHSIVNCAIKVGQPAQPNVDQCSSTGNSPCLGRERRPWSFNAAASSNHYKGKRDDKIILLFFSPVSDRTRSALAAAKGGRAATRISDPRLETNTPTNA
jgi:hypothetical protein